jgi:hypothetical protein
MVLVKPIVLLIALVALAACEPGIETKTETEIAAATCKGPTIPVKASAGGGCRPCTAKDLDASNKDGTAKYPQCEGEKDGDGKDGEKMEPHKCPSGDPYNKSATAGFYCTDDSEEGDNAGQKVCEALGFEWLPLTCEMYNYHLLHGEISADERAGVIWRLNSSPCCEPANWTCPDGSPQDFDPSQHVDQDGKCTGSNDEGDIDDQDECEAAGYQWKQQAITCAAFNGYLLHPDIDEHRDAIEGVLDGICCGNGDGPPACVADEFNAAFGEGHEPVPDDCERLSEINTLSCDPYEHEEISTFLSKLCPRDGPPACVADEFNAAFGEGHEPVPDDCERLSEINTTSCDDDEQETISTLYAELCPCFVLEQALRETYPSEPQPQKSDYDWAGPFTLSKRDLKKMPKHKRLMYKKQKRQYKESVRTKFRAVRAAWKKASKRWHRMFARKMRECVLRFHHDEHDEPLPPATGPEGVRGG